MWYFNLVIIRSYVDMGNRMAVYRRVADRDTRNQFGMAHEVVYAMRLHLLAFRQLLDRDQLRLQPLPLWDDRR